MLLLNKNNKNILFINNIEVYKKRNLLLEYNLLVIYKLNKKNFAIKVVGYK